MLERPKISYAKMRAALAAQGTGMPSIAALLASVFELIDR
jgi:hypothetical protein